MSSKTEKIPPRIDLEPLYVALKKEVGERWREYSEAVGRFVMGMSFLPVYIAPDACFRSYINRAHGTIFQSRD